MSRLQSENYVCMLCTPNKKKKKEIFPLFKLKLYTFPHHTSSQSGWGYLTIFFFRIWNTSFSFSIFFFFLSRSTSAMSLNKSSITSDSSAIYYSVFIFKPTFSKWGLYTYNQGSMNIEKTGSQQKCKVANKSCSHLPSLKKNENLDILNS